MSGHQIRLSVGGTYSSYSPDFGPKRLSGIGIYVDLNGTAHLGLEGEARFLRFNQWNGLHQDTFLAGPRYSLWPEHRLSPYAKMMLGAGRITFPSNIGYGSFFAYAPGGGVDYRLTRRLKLRGDYEYQFWPSAPSIPGRASHGLNPNGVSAGISYRIF